MPRSPVRCCQIASVAVLNLLYRALMLPVPSQCLIQLNHREGLELACEKAEISGVTWHTLRHTFASRLLERGMDIITVKELLGHSSVTVTMRYTHSNLASKVVAVGKLGATATIQLHSAPKCSSSNPRCSKLAANSQNTLELKTEEWVSG